MIGGGWAYPIVRGRVWVAADVNSRIVDGYFDASGGPAAIVSLNPPGPSRLRVFAQAGPRWLEGGFGWNAGASINIWSRGRLGRRLEYQYQWQNSTLVDQQFGASGPIGPPVYSDVRLNEHLFRAGIVIQ